MGKAYEKATTEAVPHAIQCVDPFHLVALPNTAIDPARRWAWNLDAAAPQVMNELGDSRFSL
jgi:transposase